MRSGRSADQISKITHGDVTPQKDAAVFDATLTFDRTAASSASNPSGDV